MRRWRLQRCQYYWIINSHVWIPVSCRCESEAVYLINTFIFCDFFSNLQGKKYGITFVPIKMNVIFQETYENINWNWIKCLWNWKKKNRRQNFDLTYYTLQILLTVFSSFFCCSVLTNALPEFSFTLRNFLSAILAHISHGGGASSGVFSLATEFLIDIFVTWKWRRLCCASLCQLQFIFS